jgi:hypothetical protein
MLMPFAVPMVSRKPCNNLDCYFCITNITGFSLQSEHKIEYSSIPSALRPVPHDNLMPVPEPSEKYNRDSEP